MESPFVLVLVLLVVMVVIGGVVAALWWARRVEAGADGAALHAELGRVTALVRELERDRSEKFGELTAQLRLAGEQTYALAETTGMLREALASTKARGQWGERMAEDVLRLAGFVENVNYRKQRALDGGGIPDFTFLLPNDLFLHMDVKFPLDNYMRHLSSSSEVDRRRHRDDFLRDVRDRVKELARRGYCSGDGTVDCVLLFIPNEQLFGFIQSEDPAILDVALAQKIVLCSPLTLFAVLAVVRQAVDNFMLEQTSREILGLLGGFTKQWEKFRAQMDKVGARLESAHKEYEALATTRRRQLERQLDEVEFRRRRDGVEAAVAGGEVRPLRLEA